MKTSKTRKAAGAIEAERVNAGSKRARKPRREKAHGGEPEASFGDKSYEAEARERWGDSHAWKESQARAKSYTKDDWAAMKTEMSAIFDGILGGMDRGVEDEAVQAGIKDYHTFIDQRFYTCPVSLFRGLADLWGADERYGAYWESMRPGLCEFMRSAVEVYVDRLLLVGERTN